MTRSSNYRLYCYTTARFKFLLILKRFSAKFIGDFPPGAKYRYRHDERDIPDRFIRAYRRGYVCFIEEIGGYPIQEGQSFSATFLIGYFDSIEEMNAVYGGHKKCAVLDSNR